MEIFAKNLVYVVDDELLIAEIVEVVLLRQGYEVKTFTDPTVALESFIDERAKPGLLITDYVMSPFNGLELIKRCRAVSPLLPVLVISGNIDGRELQELAGPARTAFLSKPFLPKRLLAEVHAILNDPVPV